jgi:integrase
MRPGGLAVASKRTKKLSHSDWLRLEDALRLHGDRGKEAADLMRATIIFGLRPCEWSTVSFQTPMVFRMTVKNAKATAGRAHGPTRTLTMPAGITDEDAAAVIYTVQRAWDWKALGIYDSRIAVLRTTVYRVVRLLWPRGPHPSLYTARHIFSSNSKASHPLAEVSAAMGHKSTKSATRHYGRRSSAWDPDARLHATPSEEDIASVRVDHVFITKRTTFCEFGNANSEITT